MMVQKLKQQADYLRIEIRNMEDELDRCDAFDTYKLEARKRMIELRAQLEQTEGLIERFEPKPTKNAASM